ncbi:protein kinase family protein [Couchioplanes azureus]|uniref:protein kinase family protein n=1 Tax=Couchioplanes caeruleus TaxID=56438 RepID=UPI001986D63F|nr:protein kinase family protein [Couchioplanes caeruleus]GGQ45635.1 membrane protein [Couchioplanes caeruleus subsp. azureus]
MTQVGEGHETAADEAGPVMTFGAPTVGEILAERYQLEEHVNNDSAGRQVWRGIDVILRRPVAVVLRHPGGESAAEMLQAAVDASRVIHPNLVGVYDAIDEGTRAYVVREWVDGEALRELVSREGPLDPARATAIAHSIVDALAAVHATGMVHGNVHPGTTLIADDGRVVLADARADSADSIESDIRAVGGILYYSLTGRWPHAEAGASALPDAMRDGAGAASTPRQIRAGVPAYLDDLTMDLLDKGVAAPEADALTAELARLDAADEEYDDAGPLRFTQGTAAEPVRSTRKIVVGVAALVVIALIGLVFGIRAISNSAKEQAPESTQANTAPQNGTQGNGSGQGNTGTGGQVRKIPLNENMVRIVDPPKGERNDSGEAKFAVDDSKETGWETQRFNTSDFGNLKRGMGVLINLGTPRHVSDVRVEASAPGIAMDIRTGLNDPGDTSEGDEQIVKTLFKKLGDGDTRTDGTKTIFPVFDAGQTYQYILVFISDLPPADDGEGGYKVKVTDIEVYATD